MLERWSFFALDRAVWLVFSVLLSKGDTQETCWIRREGDVVDVQELFGYIGLINLYDFQMERTHNSTCFWVLSYFPGVSSLTAMLSDAGWPQNAMGLNLLLSFQTRNPLGKLCC
ncbi:PREDICTED: uncharacterized protein LOC107880069 [Prunus mume]|uniref:Uncharacterized protein LOC107880069 n=1 Tax=Prunus mume TaxID=102107 RepID=A0ABM0N7D6_PRUMU|nr:PREDICTED: uncharacterized protein LOC107880069 [Prunus mume]